MRFMILLKADAHTEAGELPDQRLLTEMLQFNEELARRGIILSGEGLRPSSKAARVRFSDGMTAVTTGPFGDPTELVAGFWVWQLPSLEEAIEWVKRVPRPAHGGDGEIEIRPVAEAADFGAEFTPELREQEERLRVQVEAQQAAHQ